MTGQKEAAANAHDAHHDPLPWSSSKQATNRPPWMTCGNALGPALKRALGAIFVLFALGLPVRAALGQDHPDDPLGNWFNDPFIQVRSAIADCPTPLGPLSRRSTIASEEHSRVERGTSCWLAGQCEKPNAYFYDAAIAQDLAARLQEMGLFAQTSLWITVKRRFVWIEGCAADPASASTLEDWARLTPQVQLVFVNVRVDPKAKPPYVTLESAHNEPQSR
jgi:hypothetical protein